MNNSKNLFTKIYLLVSTLGANLVMHMWQESIQCDSFVPCFQECYKCVCVCECVCVCVCACAHMCMLKLNSTADNGFFFLPL